MQVFTNKLKLCILHEKACTNTCIGYRRRKSMQGRFTCTYIKILSSYFSPRKPYATCASASLQLRFEIKMRFQNFEQYSNFHNFQNRRGSHHVKLQNTCGRQLIY